MIRLRLYSAIAVMFIATIVAQGKGGTAESVPALPLAQSAQTLQAVKPLQEAYPELRDFSVQKINTNYTRASRPTPRPAPSPQFVCGAVPYTYYWVGRTPPNCTNTGAFYRRYTMPTRAAAEAVLVLPNEDAASIVMPFGEKADATGYLYIEGWPGAGASNSEGGLHYNAESHTYTPYLAIPRLHEIDNANWKVLPGSTVYLRVGSDEKDADSTTIGTKGSCRTGCVYLIVAILNGPNCPQKTICVDRERELSIGWKGNCCIFGLMTSIGRTQTFTFTGNYTFGPIKWFNPYTESEYSTGKYRYDGCISVSSVPPTTQEPSPTASPAGSPCHFAGFSNGGQQLYPDSSVYLRATPLPNFGGSVTVVNP